MSTDRTNTDLATGRATPTKPQEVRDFGLDERRLFQLKGDSVTTTAGRTR